MKYIIVDIEKIKEFSTPGHALQAIKTNAGYFVLCSDLLMDSETWGHAFDYLNSCIKVELTANDFPKPTLLI